MNAVQNAVAKTAAAQICSNQQLLATRILCGVELCPDFDGEGAIHIHILLTLPRSQVDTYIHDPLFSAQAYQCNIALWH